MRHRLVLRVAVVLLSLPAVVIFAQQPQQLPQGQPAPQAPQVLGAAAARAAGTR